MMKAAATFALICFAAAARAQTPDTILVNGKIVTVDAQSSTREALAIRDGRIVALGSSAQMRKLAGTHSRVIDLKGRTVIPGLVDSHLHAIRAAQTFATEVNWIGASSLTEALRRISEASRTMKPGAWLIVAGGWNVQQFKENRRPTQAELVAAAPNNPVYVQLGYGWAMLTPMAITALNVTTAPDGSVSGGQNTIIALFDKLPKPTFEQQIDGTKKFFRELNRLGITGVYDPGGNNLLPEDYQALFKVWRQGDMTVRVAYTLCGNVAGGEFEELKNLVALVPQGFGDDMLRFGGLGERITAAMNNNNRPTEAEKAKYYEIVKWAADRGMTLTMHWNNDASVGQLLEIFERVNKETPIGSLRWSIAHLNDASEASLRRMQALGVGWTVQDAMYFGGDGYVAQAGAAAAKRVPPVNTGTKIGVAIGGGTDAHRVASYNPFTSLQWFLDGKTVSGTAIRGPEETPSRLDALRFYTLGSTWFSFDEKKRGSLEAGKYADLAVLSKDYLTVPVDEVHTIESVLTMVGGKVVFTQGEFARLQ
jgi:hypothetical protein